MKKLCFFLTLLFSTSAFAQQDFGDAPNTYHTLLSSDGARHRIVAGMFLGKTVDAEADGLPNVNADGDDKSGVNDEDGVVFPPLILRNAFMPMQITAGADGKLDAWVDFNRDGDWADPDEQIFSSQSLTKGANFLGMQIPQSASVGKTFARFRFSSSGGLAFTGAATDGEVEDYAITITAPGSSRDVKAWYAKGQVWVTWRYDTTAAPQTFAIYRSAQPFTNVNQAQLYGRLFQPEYSGAYLANEMQQAFGRASLNHYLIPNASGGTVRLDPDQGLFVATVRANASYYYAVVPFGETQVSAANITTTAVNEIFSLADPPICHPQAQGVINGYPITFFNMWTDGDQNENAGRADFPIMANAARRGAAHLFLVMEPIGGALSGKVPVSFALHSGDAKATMWLPIYDGFKNINVAPTDGIVVALEDHLHQMFNGLPDPVITRWIGHWRGFDPFTNMFAYEGGPQPPANLLPPNDAVVIPYTLNRVRWTFDWVLANLNADPDRVAMFGHSAGGMGSILFSHVYPELLSVVNLFDPGIGDFPNSPSLWRMVGSPVQNLPTTLRNRAGTTVRIYDMFQLNTSLGPQRDFAFTRVYFGKREENWVSDDNRNFKSDAIEAARTADSLANGIAYHWDLRQHGVDKWLYVPVRPDWTIADYWVPTVNEQTRRDDVANQTRYRVKQSYPAFFNLRNYAGHGVIGTVIYDGTIPYDGSPNYDGTLTPEDRLPPFTGDKRGTWGGYFDWLNDATGPNALIDAPGRWECTMFLEGPNNPIGFANAAVDVAPMGELVADIAIRKPQNFLPPKGRSLNWRVTRLSNGAVLQSGTATVGSDGLVTITGVKIFKDPDRVRLSVSDPTVAVKSRDAEFLPTEFSLSQNFPNPFNPSTMISFQLPVNSHVILKVFDVNGREVATLAYGEMTAGKHAVTFAPRDLAGGLYFYQITAKNFSQTRKAVLTK